MMAHTWSYTDIYGLIVRYITERLNANEFTLNFSVIALCLTAPKVYIRLTLLNLQNNRYAQWEVQLEGDTLEELYDGLHVSIEAHKINIW